MDDAISETRQEAAQPRSQNGLRATIEIETGQHTAE